MKTILVTGGAGFIGSHFVRMLLHDPERFVINLDNLTYAGNLDSLYDLMDDPAHVFVHADIGDVGLLRELFEQYKPDAVVNLAAESHVDRSIEGPAPFIETNVVGTFRLLESARQYWQSLPESKRDQFRLLHVSTDEVYGSLGAQGQFSEESRYAPNSPYAASKASADHFVRAYHRTYGLPTIITNCSNNYGPYQFPEKLIPLVILNALEGKSLPVYGDGGQVRDWLYVEDHCRALLTVLTGGRPGEHYNIGGEAERTNLQVVMAICQTVDRLKPDKPRPSTSLITFVQDRPGHDRRYAIDAGKIRRELGWRPMTEFDAGLERTVRWYMTSGWWISRVTSGAYNRERLGLLTSEK